MPTEHERLLNIQNCAGMRMRRAARIINEFYNRTMQPAGLHANQYAILVPPYLKPGMTLGELAKKVALDRTTLARDLKVLEERGLIQLQKGKDQRTREIRITELGQRTMLKALPLWEEAQRQVTTQLGEARVNQLFGHLQELENLSNNDPSI